ncbi:MAG TPA: outer membrane beta-barrel protein [Nitrospiraceae bacterium]|nr:outer membrane beta-barrel protein [Nitrospiraceae bacterium]
MVVGVLALGCIACPAAAERPADKGWIQLGAHFPKIDSDMRIEDEDLFIGSTAIDLESDLDLDDRKAVPKVEAGIRLGKRFRLEADYFNVNRSESTTLSRTIVVDDHVFPVSIEVASSLKTRVYRLAAGYSFIRNQKAELGVAVGAHLSKVKARITANSLLPGDPAPRSEGRHEGAPLPNAGIYGSYALSRVFSIEGRIDAFKLKVGNYKGGLIDANLRISARMHRNIGVGVGYNYARYKLDVDKNSWNGTFKYNYSGPVTYIEFVF